MAILPKANISPVESIGSMMETIDRNVSTIDREFKQFVEKEQERLDTIWAVEVENRFYKDVVEPFTEMTSSGEYRGKEALKLPDKAAELLLKFKESVKPSNPRQELSWKKFFDTHASRINTSAIKHANEEYMKYEAEVFNSSIKNITESVSKNLSLEHYIQAQDSLAQVLQKAQDQFKISPEKVEEIKREAFTSLLKNRVAGLVAVDNVKEAYDMLSSVVRNPDESKKYKIDEVKDLILRYEKVYKSEQARDIADSILQEVLKRPNQFIEPDKVLKLTESISDNEIRAAARSYILEDVRLHNSSIDAADQQLIGKVTRLVIEKNMSLPKALSQALEETDPHYGVMKTINDALSEEGRGKLWNWWYERQRALEREKKEDLRITQAINFLNLLNNPVKLHSLTPEDLSRLIFTKKISPEQGFKIQELSKNPDNYPGMEEVKKFIKLAIKNEYFVKDIDEDDAATRDQVNLLVANDIMNKYIDWWHTKASKGETPNVQEFIDNLYNTYVPKPSKGIFRIMIEALSDTVSTITNNKFLASKQKEIEEFMQKNRTNVVFVRVKRGSENNVWYDTYKVSRSGTKGKLYWERSLLLPDANVLEFKEP